MKKFDKNYLIILLIAIVLILPLINNLYFYGHDTGFHIANITAMAKSLNWSNLLNLKIVPIVCNNFGYGTGIFYPELAHFIAAIFLENFDVTVFTSIKILNFIIMFLSGISFYKFMKTITGNQKLSLLSTLFYLTFPYKLYDIFVRDALSESLIFIFVPLVFLSIYYIFNKDYKKFYVYFIISYVGLINSHLVMTIYVTIFLVIFLLINFKKVWNKDIIKRFLVATVIVLLITLPFTMSLLIHKFKGNYVVFTNGEMANRVGVYFNGLNVHQYFIGHHLKIGYHFINIVAFILVVKYLLKIKKEHLEIKKDFLLTLGISSSIFGIWLSSYLFPWIIMPDFLLMIQFPWRLGIFTAFGISILVYYSIESIPKEKKGKTIIISVISCVLVSIYCIFNQDYVKLSASDYDLSRLGMGWQYEYLPVNAKKNKEYLDTRTNEIITDSDANISILEDNSPYLKFKIDAMGKVKIELPRLFYYGYEIKNENDEVINYYENENGFIEVIVNSGEYSVSYVGTFLEKASDYISIITVGGFIIYIIFKRN